MEFLQTCCIFWTENALSTVDEEEERDIDKSAENELEAEDEAEINTSECVNGCGTESKGQPDEDIDGGEQQQHKEECDSYGGLTEEECAAKRAEEEKAEKKQKVCYYISLMYCKRHREQL